MNIDDLPRNPALAFKKVLNENNSVLVTNETATAIDKWAKWCDQKGFMVDCFLHGEMTIADVLGALASSGSGFAIVSDGIIKIMLDINEFNLEKGCAQND